MSILATMFATVFYFSCYVSLSKGFFPALQHRKIFFAVVQLEKSKLFRTTAKKLLKQRSILLEILAILLGNRKKSLKIYCFESVQNLASFL